MIGCLNLSSQESKSRTRKSRTSSTFSDEQKAAEPNHKSSVQRYFDDSAHALTKSARAFCATATKSVVWKPTLSSISKTSTEQEKLVPLIYSSSYINKITDPREMFPFCENFAYPSFHLSSLYCIFTNL